jgi:hypothetical protein
MNRTRLVGLTCLLAVLTGTCLARQQPRASRTAAGSYQITGTVVHALTGEPLPGVTVALSPNVDLSRQRGTDRTEDAPRPAEIRPVLSGRDGSFAFTGLKAGKYSLSAAKRGFSQQGYEQHEQFATAIVAGPDKDSANLVFRVQPDASIGGRIVDEHNESVANAQVMLFREGMQNGRRGIYRMQQVQSSDEGMYRFAHVRPGKFYVAVSATPWYAQYGGNRQRMGFRADGGGPAAPTAEDGSSALDLAFPVTFYPGVTDSARAEAIELKPGQRENTDFALMAVPSLHVRINSGTSEPGQYVSATLTQDVFDSAELGVRGRNMSFGQGVTEISGITPGHYTLHLQANGQNRPPTPTILRDLEVSSSMEVNASDVPTGVNVSGTLRFDGAAPSEAARLFLRRRSFGLNVQLQVTAKGEIASEQPVQPDTYDVAFPVNGYQISQISVNGAKLKGQSVQIGTSDVRLTVVVAKSSGRLEGIALKDGKPQAGVMMVLVPEDMERPLLYRRDQSDSDGSFLMSAVTPGTYTLLAIENGWELEWSKPEVLKPYFGSGETVQVALDGKYQVNAKVQ